MRHWTISYPQWNILGEAFTKWETLSDAEILDFYWENWSSFMKRAFYDKRLLTGESDGLDLITPERCIEDWTLSHRAVRNPWREMKECIT
jgi:hypothetical protein